MTGTMKEAMTDSKLIIEQLQPRHDRRAFDCGIDSLNHYLERQAGQDIKRRIARVYIAASEDQPERIVGYYTLSTLAIELTHLPAELAQRLPRHPIPAALIGRLACATTYQGKGIGKMLLMDAIKRTIAVSEQIGIYAMAVDALNPQAEAFYRQYGFQMLALEQRRLFLPLQRLAAQT